MQRTPRESYEQAFWVNFLLSNQDLVSFLWSPCGVGRRITYLPKQMQSNTFKTLRTTALLKCNEVFPINKEMKIYSSFQFLLLDWFYWIHLAFLLSWSSSFLLFRSGNRDEKQDWNSSTPTHPLWCFLIFSIFGEWIGIMSIYDCCEKKQNGGNGWWLFELLVKFPVKSNGQFTEKQYFGAQKLVNQQGTFQRLKTEKLEFASKLVSLVVLSRVRLLNRYWVSYSKYCWKSAIW